jgi:hypothetical protein
MRAAILREFGPPEVLAVEQAPELEQVAEAHRAAEDHHGGGKIVLRV